MRFTGLGHKMGTTGPAGAGKKAGSSYNSLSPSNGSGKTNSNVNKVMPAKGTSGDTAQNNINRFMSTAKSRGGGYSNTPPSSTAAYQRSDTSAISAFRTPSGGTGKRWSSGSSSNGSRKPSNYDNPMTENKMDMTSVKSSPSGRTGALGKTASRLSKKGRR